MLHRWEYDVRELEVAEEEGRKGPKPMPLDAVLRALMSLGAPDQTDRSRTNQQG